MLSQSALVAIKKAFSRMYDGSMDVIERRKVTTSSHSTKFEDVVVIEGQPCRLSFSSSPASSDADVATVQQTTKLFYDTDIEIPEGSRIDVTQNGETVSYKQSGTTAVYETHKETIVELMKRGA